MLMNRLKYIMLTVGRYGEINGLIIDISPGGHNEKLKATYNKSLSLAAKVMSAAIVP